MSEQSQHEDGSEPARPTAAGQAAQEPRKRRPMLRGVHFCLRLAGVLVTGLAISIAVFWWRLSSGPMSLDALVPWVQEALAPPGEGFTVSVEHTELSFDPENHTLDVLADGARIKLADGSAEVALPRVALNFSLRAALMGRAAPTRIVLVSPQLHLVRAPDGTIHLGLGQGSGTEALAADLLNNLTPATDQRGTFGYLHTVLIRDAALSLEDRALDFTWQARTDATLVRSDAGISGSARISVTAGDQKADFAGEFQYSQPEHRLEGGVAIVDLNPAHFAAAAPSLAKLAAVQLPLSGRLSFSLDTARLAIDSGEGDLAVGSGQIEDPRLANGTLAIKGGKAKFAYDPVASRLAIQQLNVDLGGSQIGVSGEVNGLRREFLRGESLDHLDVSAKVSVKNLSVAAFAQYWPPAVSPSSRAWITGHLHDGVVDEARADINLKVDLTAGAEKPLRATALKGSVAFRNLTVDYFPPLTAVRGIDGTGNFDLAHFELTPNGGTLGGLRITGGSVQLTKLDTDDEQIAINASTAGPLRDILELLDSKPLHYARSVAVDPAKIAGNADVQVAFHFPLLRNLKIENVDYSAKAVLRDVAASGLVFGRDLSGGDLKFELDHNSLKLQGTGEVDQVPATIGWTQGLRDGTRHYTLKMRLDDAERRRIGVDYLSEFIKGPIDLDVSYAVQKGNGQADVSLGLRDANVTIEKFNWLKPAGVEAHAQLRLIFVGDHLTAVQQGTINGDTISAAFSVAFAPGTAELQRVELRRVSAGTTDIAGWVERATNGGWSVTIAGKSLDATKLLSDLGPGLGGDAREPLALNVKVDRLILGADREARNVSLRFVDDGVHWQTVVLDANFTDHGTLSVRYGDVPGDRDLRITSDNLGAALRLLNATDAIIGGRVTVLGRAEDTNGRRIFGGHVDGEDYVVQHAPTFARVLSVGSLSGASNLLEGKGIPFTRLRGDYVFDAGKITFSEARAYGGALGINAGGTVDLRRNTMDIAGVLVPAYTINSVLGNVPVLGPLLLGSEGGGVFGINFRVAGAADDPKVSVNPLSAVAPGFLRKLFLFNAPRPGGPPATNDVQEQGPGPEHDHSSGG